MQLLAACWEKIRPKHPFIFNFKNNDQGLSHDKRGVPRSGARFLSWVGEGKAPTGDYYTFGSILSRPGIVKTIIIRSNHLCRQEYSIEIINHIPAYPQKAPPIVTYGSQLLAPSVSQVAHCNLKHKIPAMTPFGVRVVRCSGDRQSTFDAIHVALEIWM